MLSYCLIDKDFWGKGIATLSVNIFLNDIRHKFCLKSIGAFTYSKNVASKHVLENNKFVLCDEFEDDGQSSEYYQLDFDD